MEIIALTIVILFFVIGEWGLGIILRLAYKAEDILGGSIIIVGMGTMGFFGFLIIRSLIKVLGL